MRKLNWGLQPPEGTEVAWGARTIYRPPNGVDLLWDRQDSVGEETALKELGSWINTIGLDLLRDRLLHAELRSGHSETLVVEGVGYKIEANPRSSHGYLYLVAYPA